MRRRTFILGSAASLALAACGGDESGGGAAGSATIDHQYGTTKLPSDPQRVVAAGYTDPDMVLALGTVPVLMQQWIPEWKRGVGPWSEAALGDANPTLTASPELQLERIAAARPDLILVVSRDVSRQDYEKLSAIAPTVPPPGGFPAYGLPWQDASLQVGKAMGQEAKAKQLVDTAQGHFDRVTQEYPQLEGKTAMVVVPAENGNFSVFADTDTRGRFVKSLGLTQPQEVAKLTGDAFYADVSAERTDLLESVDALIVLAESVTREAVAKVPIYKERGVIIDDLQVGMAISASSVTSIPFAIDAIVPGLAKRLA